MPPPPDSTSKFACTQFKLQIHSGSFTEEEINHLVLQGWEIERRHQLTIQLGTAFHLPRRGQTGQQMERLTQQ